MSEKTSQPTIAEMESLLARCGSVTSPGERALWLHGQLQRDFEAADDLIEALMARYPRLDILLTAPQGPLRTWLRERFPRAIVMPPPLPLSYFANRFVLNLNVRGLMFLGDLAPGDRLFLRALNRRSIPAAIAQTPTTSAAAEPTAAALGAVAEHLEHHFVTTPAAQNSLTAAGVPAARITLLQGDKKSRTSNQMPIISHLLAQDLKLIRSKQRPLRRRLERLAMWAMEHPRLRRLLCAKVERIDTIAELRETLGNPSTLLCLGNGPSSEGPEVAAVDHDCLFRVNNVWQSRGFLTEPDMVFTGSKPALASVRGSIFGLLSIKSESRLLLGSFLRPEFRRFRYATIERFGLYLSEPRWQGIRPTNGATMLATAVALQPPRLVVSGIDLFSHPAGTYPGDKETPNAYTPGHEAESELALLLEALSLYKGELTILSPALQERWEEYQSGRLSRQDAI